MARERGWRFDEEDAKTKSERVFEERSFAYPRAIRLLFGNGADPREAGEVIMQLERRVRFSNRATLAGALLTALGFGVLVGRVGGAEVVRECNPQWCLVSGAILSGGTVCGEGTIDVFWRMLDTPHIDSLNDSQLHSRLVRITRVSPRTNMSVFGYCDLQGVYAAARVLDYLRVERACGESFTETVDAFWSRTKNKLAWLRSSISPRWLRKNLVPLPERDTSVADIEYR